MVKTGRIQIRYLAICILCFALLMSEMMMAHGQGIDLSADLSALPARRLVIHWVLTCILWGLGTLSIYLYAKTRLNFDIQNHPERPGPIALIKAGVIVLLTVIVMTALGGGRLKPWAEYLSFREGFGKAGVGVFIVQCIYYCFESMLIVTIIALGQRTAEVFSAKQAFPWGGIVCGFLWGLPHLYTKDLPTGCFAFGLAILFGIGYLILRRNISYAYPFILLMLLF